MASSLLQNSYTLKCGALKYGLVNQNSFFKVRNLNENVEAKISGLASVNKGMSQTSKLKLLDSFTSQLFFIKALSPPISQRQIFSQAFENDASTKAEAIFEEGAAKLDSLASKIDPSPVYTSWDAMTEKLTISSSFVGLLMLVPQIVKNTTSLMNGNAAAVGILSWTGYSTGFLGNMLLLSYFVSKREVSAALVQTIGASSTAILLSQIYMAGYMPLPAFATVIAILGFGISVNILRYNRAVPDRIWSAWQDLTGVGGLAVLPQVVWTTFMPSSTSYLPGIIAGTAGVLFIGLLSAGVFAHDVRDKWARVSGWIATLLFMFMPVAQLQACFTKPESLEGISTLSPVLVMIANGLMIPRALFIRDIMWFTGSTWGTATMGWGVLLSMFIANAINKLLFYSISGAYVFYLVAIVTKDAEAHQLPSPLSSLLSLRKEIRSK